MEGKEKAKQRIAELEKTVEHLKQAEENYRHLLQYAPTGIYELDYKTPKFLSVNDAMCKLTGYTREELLALSPFKLLEPESAERFKERIKRGLTGEKLDENVDFRVITKDGRHLWVQLFVKPIYKDGKIDTALVVAYDVTEHKKADLAIKESERKYSDLVEKTNSIVMMVDRNLKITFMNQFGLNFFGYTNEEIIGKSVIGTTIPYTDEDGRDFTEMAKAIMESPRKYQINVHKNMLKNGKLVWVSWTNNGVYDENGNLAEVLAVGNDVSKLIEAEQALRSTVEKYRTLFHSMDEGYFVIDVIFDEKNQPVDLFYVEANPASVRIVGSDYTGKRLTEISPNYERYWFEIFGGVALTGKSVRLERYAEPDKKWYSFYVFKIGGTDSRRIGNTFLDITERKQAEQALFESKELYKTLFENTNDAFQLVEPIFAKNGEAVNCKIIEVNDAYEKQVGIRPKDVVGRLFTEIDPNIEKAWIETHATVAKTGESLRTEIYNGLTKRWFDLYLFSFGKGLVGVLFRNITYRKDLEKQLQDKERLAAIGATASMVGHDIRNPLQAMISDVFILREELTSMPECETKEGVRESLDSIESNIHYVNKIVSDLQDYTRPLSPHKVPIKVQDKINNVLKNVRVPDNIRLHIHVQEGLVIDSDADYLRRALTNLINNAVQAMPKGGDLTIQAIEQKGRAIFTIQDSGVGIPEEVKPNLFMPLFTTKSKGQGLGLAVVKRLIEALDGRVSFESKAGKGTKFVIELPTK